MGTVPDADKQSKDNLLSSDLKRDIACIRPCLGYRRLVINAAKVRPALPEQVFGYFLYQKVVRRLPFRDIFYILNFMKIGPKK
jgi:hypothetical protein